MLTFGEHVDACLHDDLARRLGGFQRAWAGGGGWDAGSLAGRPIGLRFLWPQALLGMGGEERADDVLGPLGPLLDPPFKLLPAIMRVSARGPVRDQEPTMQAANGERAGSTVCVLPPALFEEAPAAAETLGCLRGVGGVAGVSAEAGEAGGVAIERNFEKKKKSGKSRFVHFQRLCPRAQIKVLKDLYFKTKTKFRLKLPVHRLAGSVAP